MNQPKLIEWFVMGEDFKGEAGSLTVNGDKMYHHATLIARREKVGRNVKKVFLNNRRYSQTTSKIQALIRKGTPAVLLTEYEGEER